MFCAIKPISNMLSKLHLKNRRVIWVLRYRRLICSIVFFPHITELFMRAFSFNWGKKICNFGRIVSTGRKNTARTAPLLGLRIKANALQSLDLLPTKLFLKAKWLQILPLITLAIPDSGICFNFSLSTSRESSLIWRFISSYSRIFLFKKLTVSRAFSSRP